jgi:hypothetical protein
LDFQNALQTGWESHIDRPTAQAILGTKGYNALFGAMTGHGKLNGLFNSEVPQFGASREQIRSLLLELRDSKLTGEPLLQLVAATYDEIKSAAAAPAVDVNLAFASISRFLALTRPDTLISVNQGCIRTLSQWSGLPQSHLKTREGYLDLIRWVTNQPWWDSPRPKDPIEAALWDHRAALLDPFAWNEEGVSYAR